MCTAICQGTPYHWPDKPLSLQFSNLYPTPSRQIAPLRCYPPLAWSLPVRLSSSSSALSEQVCSPPWPPIYLPADVCDRLPPHAHSHASCNLPIDVPFAPPPKPIESRPTTQLRPRPEREQPSPVPVLPPRSAIGLAFLSFSPLSSFPPKLAPVAAWVPGHLIEPSRQISCARPILSPQRVNMYHLPSTLRASAFGTSRAISAAFTDRCHVSCKFTALHSLTAFRDH